MKVSIIVAMYNSEKFLDKCVTSILNQTMDDYEIILVNDCSPDNSLAIAKMYEKDYPNKIRVINHEKNLRAGAARNNGLLAAKGEYIWFVDADDWLAPTALEEAYCVAEERKSDVVSVDYYEVFSEEENIGHLQVAVADSFTGDMDLKKRNDYIVKCRGGFSKLIKREFLMNNSLFYPEGIRYEDNGIVPLVGAMAKRVDTVHKGLYFYRIGNPNSQTSIVISGKILEDRLKAMEYFLNKSKELGILDELHNGIEYFFVYIYYVSIVQSYIRGTSDVSRSMFIKIKKRTHTLFPKFSKNIYIKNELTKTCRVALYSAEIGYPVVRVLRYLRLIYCKIIKHNK